jgi:photosystem II stability/assembly factor-like uncharacterized protein
MLNDCDDGGAKWRWFVVYLDGVTWLAVPCSDEVSANNGCRVYGEKGAQAYVCKALGYVA